MTVAWEEVGWERVSGHVGRVRLPGWDCTAGLVVGGAGALLVDAGSSLAEGARLRADVGRLLGGARVTHLALTHPHFDHVFGAPAFADAEVFAATDPAGRPSRSPEELRADAVANGLDARTAAEAADALVRPHRLVTGEHPLDLGGGVRVLLANVGPGHTAHDLAVLVPGAPGAVFCGDLVEESGEPQAGPDAHPAHWPTALDRLLELGGPEAAYVPGHGAVVDAAFVRRQREELAARFAGFEA
ncbi:beta-lactamase domain protein [Actinobacteria bacterium OK074]|nr:beta-lactamase domain protein [Actinobacteria bacterium OK074]